jgi:hypothetical protein
MKIYLQKEEAIFERYGDEEAELYEKMEAMDRELQKEQQHTTKKHDNRGVHKGNKDYAKQEAEKMGFNFSKNGPPRFKNDKKKEA